MGGSNSSGTTQYIYLPTANGPMPIAAIVNGVAYAVHSDHLNTPRKLTQPDGQVAWQWAYSAFGDEQPTLGSKRFTNETTNPTTGSTSIPEVTFNLRYPGQYYDKESNLHYNYFRSYSAERGRYTQADPIGLEGGFNRFGYVESDTLSYADPEGLKSARPAARGGNSYNRRQWKRHGPKPFDRPTGEGSGSAWESGAEMFTPDPDEDYEFKCLRWECNNNSCTKGKLPTDFLPAARFVSDAPEGCQCVQSALGPIFHPPSGNYDDLRDIQEKYKRNKHRIGDFLRAMKR